LLRADANIHAGDPLAPARAYASEARSQPRIHAFLRGDTIPEPSVTASSRSLNDSSQDESDAIAAARDRYSDAGGRAGKRASWRFTSSRLSWLLLTIGSKYVD
jgi:hypothetical protein